MLRLTLAGESLVDDNPPQQQAEAEKQLSSQPDAEDSLQQINPKRIQTLNQPVDKAQSVNAQSVKKAQQSTAAAITVNNEITVNAAPGMDAKTIAEEVKNQLESREMAALRNNRFNYLDEVA